MFSLFEDAGENKLSNISLGEHTFWQQKWYLLQHIATLIYYFVSQKELKCETRLGITVKTIFVSPFYAFTQRFPAMHSLIQFARSACISKF